jgi:Flp pilus assembly secretin CpaC
MPTFYTLRVNTSVTLADGQSMLVAALSPKNKDGVTDFTRKLMVFVKADVITTGR